MNGTNKDNILKPYEFITRFFDNGFVASLSMDNDLYSLLVSKDPLHEPWREELNDNLSIAYRYNLVDSDLQSRLQKGDRESWQATMNELRVAKTFESLFGINSLVWRPQGYEKRVGEFQLKLDTPVFVEVKTVFPRDLEKLDQKVIDKLGRFASQIPIPVFLSVNVSDSGSSESFSGVKFKIYLKNELHKIDLQNIEKESIRLLDYHDDSTGLKLDIETLAIKPTEDDKECHIGVIGGELKTVTNEQYIRHSLKKAYEQLPKNEQPCLVVICPSTTFPFDEEDMLNALFGDSAVRYYFSNVKFAKKPEPFRQPNGFFQLRKHRHLSAVGLFKSRNTGNPLDIYHNPVAINSLPEITFMNKRINQLIKATDTGMKWTKSLKEINK